MTTLAANKSREYELGERNDLPVIASDIIYEGAAVGIVAGTGHSRPLVGGDTFGGFAEGMANNMPIAGVPGSPPGTAAAINVRVYEEGEIQLAVAGAVITDVGQPVYATDDDTFVFNPVGATFIGFIKHFVSAGIVVVEFDADSLQDPFAAYSVRETISANKTLDIEDNGKVFFVDTDAIVVTLPATAVPLHCKIVNIGAFGAVFLKISPVAADKIQGPDLPGTDNTALGNTKATARRGDSVVLVGGDANGPMVAQLRGIWATAN